LGGTCCCEPAETTDVWGWPANSYFVVYLTMLTVTTTIQCQKTGWIIMNWKECRRKQLWPNFRYYASICLEELRKTIKHVTISCVLAEIQTRHLLNTSRKCYFSQSVCFLLGLLFDPENCSSMFQNTGELLPDYMASYLTVISMRTWNLKPVWVFSNFTTNLMLTLL
jgi:hypothetical protein